jgi:hypothetical protein
MEVKVRFRFNKMTGEVELFQVDDEGTMRLPEAQHNREHERIAAEVGNVIEQNPRVEELFTPAVPEERPRVSDSSHPEEEAGAAKEKEEKEQ